MKACISEIFSSIQGEGLTIGQRQVFIRFAGCSLDCSWCDTPASKQKINEEEKQYTVDDVITEVNSLWDSCSYVSLTGGEPLQQVDFVDRLSDSLRKKQRPLLLETNGVMVDALKKIIEKVDLVSMDFKLPSSTRCGDYWEQHEHFLKEARRKDVYVKAVIAIDTSLEDVKKAVEIIHRLDPRIPLVFQPNYSQMEQGLVEKCWKFQSFALSRLKDVRILPQLHKILNIR